MMHHRRTAVPSERCSNRQPHEPHTYITLSLFSHPPGFRSRQCAGVTRMHHIACLLGDYWEDAKQIAAVIALPVACLAVLVLALFLISEAGTRWLAVPVSMAVLVVIYVVWRITGRRRRRKA